ncbi:MAG: hypothetical protein ACI4PR_02420 [Acutalibacteraceae bacterium]
MEKNYFDTICDTIYQNEKIKKFSVKNKKENYILISNDIISYEIKYHTDSKQITLCSCNKEDDSSKIISTWLLDENSSQKDLNLISDDFITSMVGKEKVAVRQIRKKLNENENNITELFFANRMATFFPELKELIHQEKEQYEEFRAVTFSKKFILPKVNSYIESEKNTSKISKFGKTLSELYQNAGLSVKSIITIVILNGISEENEIKLKQYLSDELKKAWEAAKKYKGKKVKPEKPKKKNSLLSKALAAQQ